MVTTEQKQNNGEVSKPIERLAQRIFFGGSIIAFVFGLFYLFVATFNPDLSSLDLGLQEVLAQAAVGIGWLLVAIFLQVLFAVTRMNNR